MDRLRVECPHCKCLVYLNGSTCPECGYKIGYTTQNLPPPAKAKGGLTVSDGVKAGCGAFVVLPIVILILITICVLIFLILTKP